MKVFIDTNVFLATEALEPNAFLSKYFPEEL